MHLKLQFVFIKNKLKILKKDEFYIKKYFCSKYTKSYNALSFVIYQLVKKPYLFTVSNQYTGELRSMLRLFCWSNMLSTSSSITSYVTRPPLLGQKGCSEQTLINFKCKLVNVRWLFKNIFNVKVMRFKINTGKAEYFFL